MIHDIPEPEISPAFTIEDIHKIREWNWERLKNATNEERMADTARRAASVEKELERRRRERQRGG